MKILILNQLTNNVGDDAAGFTLQQNLKELYPDANLDIVYIWNYQNSKIISPFYDSNHHSNLDLINIHNMDRKELRKLFYYEVPIYVLHKLLNLKYSRNKILSELDSIIQSSDKIFLAPCGANIGIYSDWFYLLRTLQVVLNKKIPIFYLNTIGKSKSKLFNFIADYVLRKSILFVREKKSFDYLKEKKINVNVGVDIVFGLKSEMSVPKENAICFIPTELSNWHVDFINTTDDHKAIDYTVKDISKLIKMNNYKLYILSHLYNELNENELLFSIKNKLINEGIDDNKIEIVLINTFQEYEKTILKSKITISMRYHGVIFAAKNNIPFLSLSYENKMDEVSKYTLMDKYNIKIKDVKEDVVYKKLLDIEKNFEEIETILKNNSKYLIPLSKLPILHDFRIIFS
jgi:polysaccharide pyruvyl transferase WcaK-like protein